MKLRKSIENANSISDRLKKINGMIHTPLHSYQWVKVKRAWLFGSTAKGKLLPNDTDILVELAYSGRCKHISKGVIIDKYFKKTYGVTLAKSAEDAAITFLKNRKHHVNIHPTTMVDVDIDVKILIYPRNDLKMKPPKSRNNKIAGTKKEVSD